MKILHTADWHLGKRLYETSRLEEQKAVLEEICHIADTQQVDAILIAGDLYDTFNPPAEAVELFYKTVRKLSKNGERPVIAIAGNHDSADRIQAPDPLAKQCGIFLAGHPDVVISPYTLDTGLAITQSDKGFIELALPRSEEKLRIILAPYANESRLKAYIGTENSEETLRELLQQHWQYLADTYCDSKGVNVLVNHSFMIAKGSTPPEEPEDERPILHIGGAQALYTENIPSQIQYTALGHLHRQHFVGKENSQKVAYSGSLLSYSFSEANQQKYVLIVDVKANEEAATTRIPIQKGLPLFRRRFEDSEEAIEWLLANPDCFVELTLVTDEYLDASLKKKLFQSHSGIMAIIPELTQHATTHQKGQKHIDLTKNREELFKEYFQSKHGQVPNESIMAILKEIL